MRPMQRFVDLYSSLRSLGCCGLQNTAIASSIKLQNKPKKCLPEACRFRKRAILLIITGDHNANHMSIHAPLTGRQAHLAAGRCRYPISIRTLPMRGATTWYAPVPGT